MPFLSQQAEGTVSLDIHVQPQASKSKIVGLHDSRLKVAVAAPPVDGKANNEVVRFFAKFIRIPKRDVVVQSGAQSKRKRIVIRSISMQKIRTRIEEELGKR